MFNRAKRTSFMFLLIVFGNISFLLAQEPRDHSEPREYKQYKLKYPISSDSIYPSRLTQRADLVLNTVFKPNQAFIADSLIKVFDDSPSFGIFKDNYIVIGTDLLRNPNPSNSDAKFQISVSQRLTNSVLPFRTYLFITYSQLAFWDIFKKSFPFRDINFNPSVGLGRPLIYNNRYLGELAFQFEHESNGKAEDDSRSWNKISLSGQFKITPNWSLFHKIWLPIVDGENNPDLAKYKGWAITALSYGIPNKFNASLILNKRKTGFFDTNITLNFAYRLFKEENQYLFFEFYDGYGESLLDYNQYRQRFRIGFVIKPNFKFVY